MNAAAAHPAVLGKSFNLAGNVYNAFSFSVFFLSVSRFSFSRSRLEGLVMLVIQRPLHVFCKYSCDFKSCSSPAVICSVPLGRLLSSMFYLCLLFFIHFLSCLSVFQHIKHTRRKELHCFMRGNNANLRRVLVMGMY